MHLLAVGLRIWVQRDALVVNLDLFAGLQIVVDDHLVAAADQGAAHLDRRQPIDVDVGDQLAFEEERQIGDVLRLAEHMAHARRRNRHRPFLHNMVQDREIMHREVPDNADIVLEEPQIDPDRVVIIHVAQAAFDEFAHLADGAGVDEGMIHGQHEASARRFFDHPCGFLRRRCHRLFDEDMLSGHHRLHCELEMGRDRRCDGDCIHLWIAQNFLELVGDRYCWIPAFNSRQPFDIQITN